MADYKYEAETIRIMELSSAIKVIAEHVDDFSYEIETEDVLKLQRQLKNAVKTADRIVEHLSSLNTKEDREAYIKAQKQKEQAEKVAVLLQSSNVLEYHSMNAAGITNEDIVAFQEYYNVRLWEQGYGTWRWLSVHDIEGNHLSGEDFVKIGIRTEQNMADKIIEKAVQTVKSKESVNPYDNYGWVRPDGSFIPSEWRNNMNFKRFSISDRRNRTYQDDVKCIRSYLESVGTLDATDDEIACMWGKFSEEYYAASWMTIHDELLEGFVDYLEGEMER